MSRRRSNVARLGPPDPLFVRYPGSDAAASLIKYIVCLNGQVPERYEVWSLNARGVCEVHPTAWVNIFDLFAEDTFWSTFFNSQRCRVLLISILSALRTSLQTVLWTLSLPKRSSCIPGSNIRIWLVRLTPIILVVLIFWLRARRASSRDVSMSVCACYLSNGK